MAESHDAHSTVAAEYRSPIARHRPDWSSPPPSSAVVEAVAAVATDDPTELEPLTEAVDPDALDRCSRRGNRPRPRRQDLVPVR